MDGIYRVLIVDTTVPSHIRIKVKDMSNQETFTAAIFDNSLDQKYKTLIQEAEWSKLPIQLLINAKDVGGQIKGAEVISATKIDIEDTPNLD